MEIGSDSGERQEKDAVEQMFPKVSVKTTGAVIPLNRRREGQTHLEPPSPSCPLKLQLFFFFIYFIILTGTDISYTSPSLIMKNFPEVYQKDIDVFLLLWQQR